MTDGRRQSRSSTPMPPKATHGSPPPLLTLQIYSPKNNMIPEDVFRFTGISPFPRFTGEPQYSLPSTPAQCVHSNTSLYQCAAWQHQAVPFSNWNFTNSPLLIPKLYPVLNAKENLRSPKSEVPKLPAIYHHGPLVYNFNHHHHHHQRFMVPTYYHAPSMLPTYRPQHSIDTNNQEKKGSAHQTPEQHHYTAIESPMAKSEKTTSYKSEKETTDIPTRKRYRTVFTLDQRLEMEELFAKCKYLRKIDRARLAKKHELGEVCIKIWFQNRRVKDKRENDC